MNINLSKYSKLTLNTNVYYVTYNQQRTKTKQNAQRFEKELDNRKACTIN